MQAAEAGIQTLAYRFVAVYAKQSSMEVLNGPLFVIPKTLTVFNPRNAMRGSGDFGEGE